MLDRQNLVALGKALATADRKAPVAYSAEGKNYSYENLNDTFREQLNELVGTPAKYAVNQWEMFSILEEVIDTILPKKVAESYKDLAEFKQYAQGERVVFKRPYNSRTRAKQFITRVGLAGRYEVFKLSKGAETFEIKTSAIGAAAEIAYEEFLDGKVDFAELEDIITEGIDELIYREIAKAMSAGLAQLPAANKASGTGFSANVFEGLLMKANAYGTPTIYCTHEFAVKLLPADAWRYSEDMKNELYRTGRLALYKGYNVVVLEQSFEDATLTTKVLNPGQCWIVPAGANTKPIKVAFEGGLQMRDVPSQEDWSHRIEFYQKVGVVPMFTNDIFCYTDTTLDGQYTTWNVTDDASNNVNVNGNVTTTAA